MSNNVTRLYKQFQPKYYKLHLNINKQAMIFTGLAVIRGQKTGRPSKRITFHQKDLVIASAQVIRFDKKNNQDTVDISRINHHRSKDEVRLHSDSLLYPGDYEITLEFSGNITKPMSGIYPSFYKDEETEKIIIATQFESHHAREAFPCIDEPEAKAVFKLTLATSNIETNISNNPIESEEITNGIKTTTFSETPIMSSYLLAFVSGELAYLQNETKNGVVVRTYATPKNVEHTQFALDTAVKCLEYFNDYFDIDYPLPKCDLIALPDFASGAMENWGCITFREQVMIYDPQHTSLSVKQYIALVVAHELAHQWFGNLVTMRWWTDLWLNEGFASWIEYLVCNELFPEWKLWEQFLIQERDSALKLDALDNTHPIEVPVKHPDEIRTIFDAISYSKGASVINMLHEYLGPQVFRNGLRHYLHRFAYNNTDTSDLWESLETVSGKPVKKFMNAWTSLSGFPILSVGPHNGNIAVSQKRFTITPGAQEDTDSLWPIPLLRHQNKYNHTELLTKQQQSFPYNHDDFVQFNRGQTGFYRTSYDASYAPQFVEAIQNGLLYEVDRLGLLSDSFEASKTGIISSVDTLTLLDAYRNEDSTLVWDVIAGGLASLKGVMDDENLRESMKPYIRKFVEKQLDRLGWEAKDQESHFDSLLRPTILSLASVADETSVIDVCHMLFKAMHDPDDINPELREGPIKIKRAIDINPDLRGVVYGTVVRHGGKFEFDKLLEMHNESDNSEERVTIASALTGFKQPELIDRALSLITTDVVRLQDVTYWIAYSFSNRFARDKTWQWMIDNWQWLTKNFEGDLGFYRMPVYAARSYSNPEFLEKFENFFADKQSPSFDRSIKQGREILKWHIAWRERDLQAIKSFFDLRVND